MRPSSRSNQGHLDVIKWLHVELGFSIGHLSHVTDIICKGHLDVLKYLSLHCDVNIMTYHVVVAVERGHFDLLEWLLQQYPATANQQTLEAYAVNIWLR